MRYALLLVVLVFVGCSSSRTLIPGFTDVRGIDLRPYAEEGFLFTPEPYEGEYEALGQIILFMYPEARRSQGPRSDVRGGVYNAFGPWQVQAVLTGTAVDSLYQLARSWGADAVMNFDYGLSEHPFYTGLPGEPTRDQLMGVRVEGFAIRRK